MSKVVGIDLGTTFSAIAYVNKHGHPEIIPNREGERITPSVVLFEENEPIVGSIAKRSAIASPYDTAQYVKRQMGNPSYKFYTEGDRVYTAEEISAIILKRLKEDAETFLNESIRDAVITVPAYFDDAQRKATQDAGQIAGLNVLRIINEPTAAALAYGVEKMNQEQTALVYDLGGGTFDVTIMKLSRDGINVIATDGDKNLGGFDWDNEIMKFLNEEFKKQGGIDLLSYPTLEQDLRDRAEAAKKTLSSRSKAKISLFAAGKKADIPLTLEKFQEITKPLLERTRSKMENVLEDAQLEWRDIDKILLVGGSTRMKAVPALIEEVTKKKPSKEVHPNEVVAIGASLQGTLLHLKEGKTDLVERESFPIVEVKDVNSHSMGVVLVERHDYTQKYNHIILEKNTSIPCKVSDTIYTIDDRQTHYECEVTEGEDRNLKYVKIVGHGMMKLPPYPKNSPLEVIFEYDSDGIIHVTVFDLVPNPKKKLGELQIKRNSNLNEREVLEKRQQLSNLAVN